MAQIVTYGQEKLRSGIDDLCRTLKEYGSDGTTVIKYGQELADIIKKTIPGKFPDQTEPTYEKMVKLANDPESFRDDFRGQTDKLHEQAKEFMQHMHNYPEIHTGLKFIEGLVRNYGRHAAAVVITDEPITDHIPTYRLNKDDILPVTAFNMKEVDEDLQMLKLDALSLSTETVVQRAVENIQKIEPDFKLKDIPEEDEAAIKTIADGHTTGIFQVSGGPITAYTKKVKPYTFDHITDILGLFRPGPLEAEVKIGSGVSMADQYCENYYQDTLDEFLNEIPGELRYIYQDTRGILVYQEQIMQLAQDMAGYTLGGADILRRAIGKKDKNLIQAVRYEFIYGTKDAIPKLEAAANALDPTKEDKKYATFKKELKGLQTKPADKHVEGCIARGYNEDYALNTYAAIERFSGYSFNRSHSAAYAMIAYQTAYLKTHYPAEFMAALLTVEAGDAEDTMRNILECRRLGIPILPPHINHSGIGFTIEETPIFDEEGRALTQNGQLVTQKGIRFGLQAIAGVGPGIIEEVLRKPGRKQEWIESLHEGDEPMDTPETTEGLPYRNFDDFFHRVDKRKVNKAYLEKLIKAGCFDFDVANRYQMLNHFYFNLRGDKPFLGTLAAYQKAKKEKKVKADTAFQLKPSDYNEDVLCEMEEEFFGFYLTHHPYADLPYENWDDVAIRNTTDMGGKITKIKKTVTKAKKEEMCFLEVETAGGKIDITVFPRTYEEFKPELFKGNIAIFRGRKELDQQKGKAQMILDQVLKVRKKKFVVEKPPELAELAAERKLTKKGPKQATLDFAPVVREDPLGDLFGETMDAKDPFYAERIHAEGQDAQNETAAGAADFDLASLFD